MPIDPASLRILLTASEDTDEFRRAVSHFEDHPELYGELEQVVIQDMEWLQDAQNILREEGLPELSADDLGHSVTVQVNGSLAEDDPVDFERVPLDFLETPSHPELLGRLGRYDIERVIGTGGMGIVLKAWDTDLHRVVAIKVLSPHLANHSSARRRFAREAQAAAAVVHPHVIPIYNVASDERLPYLVMQYVAGESLQQRVERLGPLPLSDVLRIAMQTAAGLAAAHSQGLVHRDVKPANILLEDQVDRVLLSDFGLARTIDDASLTRTGIVAGTPFYMSPEQALGERIDQRSDLFSLGAVIYFMLTGRVPFRASNAMAVLRCICHEPHQPLEQLNPDVPEEFTFLVDGLLQKRVSERTQTAVEVESAIGNLLSDLQQGRLPGRCSAGWRKVNILIRRLLTRNQYSANRNVAWPAGRILLAGTFLLILSFCLGWLMRIPTPETLEINSTPQIVSSSSPAENGQPENSSPAASTTAPDPASNPITIADLRKMRREYAEMQQQDAEFSRQMGELTEQLRLLERENRSLPIPMGDDLFFRESARLKSRLDALPGLLNDVDFSDHDR